MTMPQELYVDTQGIPLHCRFSGPSDLSTPDAPPLAWGIAPSPLGQLLAVWLRDALWRLCFVPASPSPTHLAPAYLAPAYPAPAHRAPAHLAPAHLAPTHQAPTYLAPAYLAPTHLAPASPFPAQALEAALRPYPASIAARLPAADHQRAARLMTHIFSGKPAPPLRLRLEGTPFQCRVWHALLHVPHGQTVSYGALAQRAGYPQAARAVGTAMAQNPIVFLVPCHRVVRAGGQSGNYGGGAALKARLLDWERRSPQGAPMPRLCGEDSPACPPEDTRTIIETAR